MNSTPQPRPDPKYSKGDIFKYNNNFYIVFSINLRCYECMRIYKDKSASSFSYFFIHVVEEHAVWLGKNLETVRLLYQ